MKRCDLMVSAVLLIWLSGFSWAFDAPGQVDATPESIIVDKQVREEEMLRTFRGANHAAIYDSAGKIEKVVIIKGKEKEKRFQTAPATVNDLSQAPLRPAHVAENNTDYAGDLKGIGRICRHTVVDTYSSVAFVKLYIAKVPVTTADTLNDRVLPFFEDYDTSVTREGAYRSRH